MFFEGSPEFTTIKSNLLSPLKSPTARALGPFPEELTAEFTAAWKVPSPLPSRMLMLLLPELTTAMSGLPSPLKSPIATAVGLVPTG